MNFVKVQFRNIFKHYSKELFIDFRSSIASGLSRGNCYNTQAKTRFYCSQHVVTNQTCTVKSMDNNADVEMKPSDNAKVTYLPSPVKSPNDKKEYSVIRLSNGLTALLISDVTNILKNLGSGDEEEDAMSEGGENAISDDEGGSVSTTSDEAVENPFGNKDAEEKQAACALCVGVGSFSDPETAPGLAHFLEHMIFMGSEKYPAENDFDTFISKRGGHDNASTECEYTTFYFNCHEMHLRTAMDKFANFFISPLLLKDAMTREREAVDSEFQMALPVDESRMEQLLCSTAIATNPAHKFTWGNLVTLRDNIADDDLYNELQEFRKRHYSAHRMTLAIQGRLPLKVMEDWVVECFSDVPCNNLPADVFPYVDPPFKHDEFGNCFTVKPIKDVNKIDIFWAFPPVLHLYRSKPMQYIGYILGHEGKGSLISQLRKNLWALNINAGNQGTGLESNTMYSIFTLSVSLTEEGLKNIDEVFKLIFCYLNMMKLTGPQERIFTELQSIAENRFRFQEEISSADYVENLCEQMQFYKPEEYINADDLFFEYKPEDINLIMDKMEPDNAMIVVSSKLFAKPLKLDKVEPWFKTKYNRRPIPESWLTDWKELNPNDYFSIPEPNIFITDNFDLLPLPENLPEYPEIIKKDEYFELWYKQDKTFRIPTGIINLLLVSPLASLSVKNVVMMDLYVSILRQLVIEETYPAVAADLDCGMKVNKKGFILKVKGYNQKLDTLLEQLLKSMVSFNNKVTLGLFNTIKQEMGKSYSNTCLKTGLLGNELRLKLLVENSWTSSEKHSALSSITLEDLTEFVSDYFKELYMHSLVQGNISKEKAIEIIENSRKILGYTPALQSSLPEIRVCQIPIGEKVCCCEAFNKKDKNSEVINYYQIGMIDLKEQCKLQLLMMIMEEPLFDTLRTKEQLGYTVSCAQKDTWGIHGFTVSVSFQIHKHSVQHVENRISGFLNSFMDILKEMPEEEFLDTRSSLVRLKQNVDVNLGDEVKRNWAEITDNWNMFDRAKREIELIETLTQEDIYNFLENCIKGEAESQSMRKLSIQIEAVNLHQSDDDQHDDQEEDANEDVEEPTVLDLILKNCSPDSNKYITDLDKIKNNMYLYPSCHPLKDC
ncbi:nardilysin [Nilaparvata lugens]|uniref:nardilysin n=1 Tax=Nilaparvata lugens TaxID=108931 RepID=UPI00193E96D6|nr:nardilysin [Nilaparvata lugens]